MHNASFTAEYRAAPRPVRPSCCLRREELIRARKKAWEAHLRRLAARAAAQQATRDLEAAVAEAHEVATRLRCTVWGEYGRESPALHVFGMRPYPRTRARAAAASVNEGESLPNVIPEPAPPPPAPGVKGEPSPSVRDAGDRRGTVPQREPDAQTRSGGLVNDGERLPNDRRLPTFDLAVAGRARDAEEQGGGSPQHGWMPTAPVGEAAPPGADDLPAG
jgi:hypothetical protein